ncbi:hypothetical protein GCM10022268_25750 [Sphingomonas cynarae]|uniref:Uncharacterized protein n=1 Tax=Sphingomonas cynarae TaxID=930197 RepID=A0ABP7E9C0_9SPHN
MMDPRLDITVAMASAHTAEVQAWRLAATREQRELIEATLHNLFDLGHVVAFSVCPDGGTIDTLALVDEFRLRFGGAAVDSCLATSGHQVGPSPSFLMPVWAFDHAVGGAPAATGRLLGLELELIARPGADEETGAHLPGRTGRWLIHARPMF